MRRISCLSTVVAVCLVFSAQVPAAPNEGLYIALEDFERVPLSSTLPPLARINMMREVPDGTGRLFVNDLNGPLHLIEAGTVSEYMDLSDLLVDLNLSPGLAAGFVSFTFAPDFALSGRFYTVHSEIGSTATPNMGPALTTTISQHSVLTEWTATSPAANTFAGTSRELIRIASPHNFHNMAEIAFNPLASPGHPDYGLLYIGTGDFGSVRIGEPAQLQRLDSPFGTVMRIDPLGGPFTRNSITYDYGIPPANPFVADPTALGEIFAYGFRNAHRFSWDPDGVVVEPLVSDIGQGNFEEINRLIPGANYGWPLREGNLALDVLVDAEVVFPLPANDATFGFTYPVALYDHDTGAAISSGFINRNTTGGPLDNKFVTGDIVSGQFFYSDVAEMLAADDDDPSTTAQVYELNLAYQGQQRTLLSIVSDTLGETVTRVDLRLATDTQGQFFVTTKQDGAIRTLTFLPANQVPVLEPVGDKTLDEGQLLSFAVVATDADDSPLSPLALSASNLPAGATFDPASGAFAWATTGSDAGTYAGVLFEASDGQDIAAESITITVSEANQPPFVNAGADQVIYIGSDANLDGTVTDDSVSVTTTWSEISGPAAVSFGDVNAIDTTASFSIPGIWILRLTADDGELSTSDDVTIAVLPPNQPPVLDPVGDRNGSEGQLLSFVITANDPDNSPVSPPSFSASGLPPGASFDPVSTTFAWTPTFADAGSYPGVRFEVSDGFDVDFETITISIADVNLAPIVDAGFDEALPLAGTLSLNGTVTDDGSPAPPGVVTTLWSQASGPGTASIANPGQTGTTVTFDLPGTYVLRLTADDSNLASFDELTVDVSTSSVPEAISLIREDCTGVANCYTSLAAWESAEQRNLVAAGQVAVARIEGVWNSPDTTSFTIDGWTTDSDHYVKITTAGAARHAGVWSESAYRLESADGTVLVVRDGYTQIEGLQIGGTRNGSQSLVFLSSGASHTRITGNLLRKVSGGGSSNGGVVSNASVNEVQVDSNIVQGLQFAIGNFSSSAVNRLHAYANTIYGASVGLSSSAPGSVLARNNLVVASTNPASGTFAAGSDFNMTDAAGLGYTVTGRGNASDQASRVVTFVDEAGGDLHLDATDIGVRDLGTGVYPEALYRLIDDIDGLTRLLPWDGGADELSVGGPVNEAPVVDAGPDLAIVFGAVLALDGTVVDDSLPNPPGTVTTTWSEVSGPGVVTFSDAGAVNTTASFSSPGTWVLRLTADDGALAASDELTVLVLPPNQPPVLDPIGDRNGVEGQLLSFVVTANDPDNGPLSPLQFSAAGLPPGATFNPGSATFLWTPTFADGGGHAGVRFDVTDGADGDFEIINITIADVNQAPVVDAGPDQASPLVGTVSLDGTVSDDGSPVPPGVVTTLWSQVSGVGTASFAEPDAIDTTVTFDLPGTYVLRLTGDDGHLTTFDEMTVSVSGSTVPESVSLIREDCTGVSGCYTSLAAWEATEQRNLVASGEVAVARIEGVWNTPDTTGFTIDGWTTDSDHHVKIVAVGPARHAGVWSETAYRLASAAGTVLVVRDAFTHIEGLQIGGTRVGSQALVFLSSGATRTRITGNLLTKLSGGGSNNGAVVSNAWDNIIQVDHNIVQDLQFGIGNFNGSSLTQLHAYANTIHGATEGLTSAAPGSVLARNNLIVGSTSAASGTFAAGSDFNMTDAPALGYTVSGGGNINDQADRVVTFVDAAGGDLHLDVADTGARDLGTADYPGAIYPLGVDIDGAPRLVPWDGGADEVSGGPPLNQVPVVDAGPDQVVNIGTAGLDGTVVDDGLPAVPGVVTTVWSQVSGPAAASFGDASAIDTTASFTIPGTWVLRLGADDSELAASDELTITVLPANQPPVFGPIGDKTVDEGQTLSFVVTATDPDNSPLSPPLFSASDLPPGATFDPASATFAWTPSFADAGVHAGARFEVSDGADVDFEIIAITVGDVNQAPVVVAGSNQTSPLVGIVSLDGNLSDDGSPVPPGVVTTSWSQVSGPGTASFADPGAVDTTVTFDLPGIYVLRLNADDGSLVSFDELTVTVTDATVPEAISLIREDCTGVSSCYTSLALWEAAEQRDLVAAGEVAVARIEGAWAAADTVGFTIDGWTTDSDHYVKIIAVGAARHGGVWSDSAYRLVSTAGTVVVIRDEYTHIEGLQIGGSSPGSQALIFLSSGATQTRITGNLLRKVSGGGSSNGGIASNAWANETQVDNNIVQGLQFGIGNFNGSTPNRLHVYANTISGASVGLMASAPGSVLARNNLIVGSASAAVGVFAAGTDFNVTDASSVGYTVNGGGNLSDQLLRIVTFVDQAGGDLHLDITDTGARDLGTASYPDALDTLDGDIDAQTRQVPWDAGADEAQ